MINLQLAVEYLRHRFQAKNRHGVHSPFTYRMVDEVIYDFRAKASYPELEVLRKRLLADERQISVTDLGAGSHVNNNRIKTVKDIAENALKPPRLAQLLYRLAEDSRPARILELGTCLGLTTCYLAKAAPGAEVFSIEGCPETAAIARENLRYAGVENVEILVGNFDHVLPELLKEIGKVDFIFIDGNHRKEATLNYFELLLPHVHQTSVIIFDDIYWSRGMKEAWQEIISHPAVTLSIDLFWVGLVYFRKGRLKENFKIRF